MKTKTLLSGFIICILVFGSVSLSASEELTLQRGAIPFGLLNRVLKISYKSESGTCFVIDIDNRQYIITAGHLTPGIKDGDSVKIFVGQEWSQFKVKPIFPEKRKTDTVALAADRLIAPKMNIVVDGTGIFLAQDMYFLGYPYDMSTKIDIPVATHIPFVKKAILSAATSPGHDSGNVLFLDGHNNPGFSGGPVVFANYQQNNRLQIAGVVSGYRYQPLPVVEEEIVESKSTSGDSQRKVVRYVRENTGIVIAYDIGEIVKAIRANPIGPLLTQSD